MLMQKRKNNLKQNSTIKKITIVIISPSLIKQLQQMNKAIRLIMILLKRALKDLFQIKKK